MRIFRWCIGLILIGLLGYYNFFIFEGKNSESLLFGITCVQLINVLLFCRGEKYLKLA